jgi:DNA (cytosine-5)-methyltransferase 1
MGWQAAGFSEIEKFPSEVLAHHYPTVTNFGDMTKYKEWKLDDPIGLLVGGTPCQSFSVAGLRKGLDDPRGNLALTYLGILDKFRPKWCVWENVPGVLSSGGGRDFGAFLGALGELGYGFAYRVLDAQNFGVAQRRRRVFVVGCLGDWRAAAEVLFESESLSGNTKPSRAQRESVTGYVESSFGQYREDVIAGTSKASGGVMGGGSETFLTIPIHDQATRTNKGNGLGIGNPGDPSPTLTRGDMHMVAHCVETFPTLLSSTAGVSRPGNEATEHQTYVAFGWQNSTSQSMSVDAITPTLDKSKIPAVAYSFDSLASNSMKSSNPLSGCRQVELSKTIDTTYPCPSKNQGGIGILQSQFVDTYNGTIQGDVAATMTADMAGPTHSGPKVMQNMAVRRLTPVECERLQGFPDNYTNIKNKCPDGPRYKAMGNSMAVPVMRWIGERINKVNSLL